MPKSAKSVARVVAGFDKDEVWRRNKAMNEMTRRYMDGFWELLDDMLNALLFALAWHFLGLQVIHQARLVTPFADGNHGLDCIIFRNFQLLAGTLVIQPTHAVGVPATEVRLKCQMTPGSTCVEGMGRRQFFLG